MHGEASSPQQERQRLLALLDETSARHTFTLDCARPEAVAKQHAKGALTARERIALLLDEGESFVEYGQLARPAHADLAGPADGVVVGFGRVHGRISVFISYDYTVLGGSQGRNSHAKTSRAMWLAHQLECPVYLLIEGGGGRTQELSLPHSGLLPEDFSTIARMLSGRVPIVGLGFGRAFAGHAIFLGEADVIIAVETAAIGIAGPPLVKASTGQDLTPEEIGGARIHEESGAAELIVPGDVAAITAARAYARYFVEPEIPYDTEFSDAVAEELRQIALATADGPLQMRRVIELVADRDSLFELRGTWSTSVRTVLARIGGRSAGIVATDPCSDGGVLTSDACDKITRFVYLCDAFGLPVVNLVDTVGVDSGLAALTQALPRHAARIPLAFSNIRVPVCTFILGRCPGVAQLLIGGAGRARDLLYFAMWPIARLEGLGMLSNDRAGEALTVGEKFAVDDVIDPGATRQILLDVIGAVPPIPRRAEPRQIDNW